MAGPALLTKPGRERSDGLPLALHWPARDAGGHGQANRQAAFDDDAEAAVGTVQSRHYVCVGGHRGFANFLTNGTAQGITMIDIQDSLGTRQLRADSATRLSACRPFACCTALWLAIAAPIGETSFAADDSEALLDQLSAVVDANTALIQRGVARYRIVSTEKGPLPNPAHMPLRYRPRLKSVDREAKPRGPFNAELTVYFDYPRLRFDWHGQRLTVNGDALDFSEQTIFDGTNLIRNAFFSKPRVPGEYRVNITAAQHGARNVGVIHPREQAVGLWSFGTDLLSRRKNDKETTLTATTEADGLVRVVLAGPTGTEHFWLSPAHAFSVVRSKWWRAVDSPETDEPNLVNEATFREVGNGAFVLEHRMAHNLVRDQEVTLLEIEMRDRLDPKLFSLDGLDLPVGAFIIDSVHGRNYEYGVPSVDESEVKTPVPKRP